MLPILHAFSQHTTQFAKGIGGLYSDYGNVIQTDASGNIYVGGTFNNALVDFNPDPVGAANLNSNGRNSDVFFAKYSSTGAYVWAKSFTGGGDNADYFYDMTLDASNNIYMTGGFKGTPDFDPATGGVQGMTSTGEQDMFFGKYNSTGGRVWSNRIGGTKYVFGKSIAVDKKGYIYVSGYFEGSDVDFNPGTGVLNLTNQGIMDVFFAKFKNDGTLVWVKSFGGIGYDYAQSMALDDSANIYITGAFEGSLVDFDPGAGITTLSSAGNSDIFYAKYDSSGTIKWAKRIGGLDFEQSRSITIDSSKNIFICGYFKGANIDFDPGASSRLLTSAGGSDIFIGKYTKNGDYLWAHRVGSSLDDVAQGVDIDGFGNSYFTGYFSGTNVDFNPGASSYPLSSNGAFELFLTSLDPSGNFLWANSIGGKNNDEGNDIAVDINGTVNLTGYYINKNVDFDITANSILLDSVGYSQIAFAKYKIPTPTMEAKNIVATNILANSISIKCHHGNGYRRAIFAAQGYGVLTAPQNNKTYAASTVFGTGNQIASSGYYCVYNGTDSAVTVTGLTPQSVDYTFVVYEYNGYDGVEQYATIAETNNPKTFTTGIDLSNVDFDVSLSKLMNTTTLMEYELNASNNWITCMNGSTQPVSFVPGSLKIREKISPTNYRLLTQITKPSTPLFSIDYVNEQSLEAIPEYIEFSTQADFATSDTGMFQAISLTPGQDVYFRTIATKNSLHSDNYLLTVKNRPSAPINSINFGTEYTSDMVSESQIFASQSDFSDAIFGNNSAVKLYPNVDLYIRKAANATDFSSEILYLDVPARIAAPNISIDFEVEKTNINIPTDIEFSTSVNMTGSITGNDQKVQVTPGDDLYFRYKSSLSAFASEILHLDAPTRPSKPNFSIDFAHETTMENVGVDIVFDIAIGFPTPQNGSENKVTITPGTNLYFKKKATASAFSSLIQSLIIPGRSLAPTYSIDYVNESTNEIVSSSDEYSINANFSSSSSGNDDFIDVNPGEDLYFRTKASEISFSSEASHLVVNPRPQAPLITIMNDDQNYFDWNYIQGFDLVSDYEYTTDGGSQWINCMAKPQTLENIDIPIGDLQIRVKCFSNHSFFGTSAISTQAFSFIDGIENIQNNLYSIYPNLTQGEIFYKRKNNENTEDLYQIYNQYGQLVQEGFASGNGIIDISHNSNGIYYIRISNSIDGLRGKIILAKQ